jgi:two-component sensor histidine kinase
MSGAEAPVDVLVVDGVVARHDSYRDLLGGIARRVVAVVPGADARRLYGEGDFAAALIHLDGAMDEARADLAAIAALRDVSPGPPVIVISDRMPDPGAIGVSPAGSFDYVPVSYVRELLASRISCLMEIKRLRGELASRDAQLDEMARRADEMMAAAAEERRLADLLRERVGEQIHRSKNLLAILQSIAHRTISDGREIPEVRDALMGRLRALARAYHLVTKADGKGTELSEVVEAELAELQHRVATSGPPVRLSASAVQTFALAIHELAANAAKHGALGSPNGSVAVGWTFFEYGADRYLEVAWTERGGPPPKVPPRYGFGLTLVSSFAGTGASAPSIAFGAEGLTCRMRLPQDMIVTG